MSQQKILRELVFLAIRTLGRGIWGSPSQTAQTSKPLSSRTSVFREEQRLLISCPHQALCTTPKGLATPWKECTKKESMSKAEGGPSWYFEEVLEASYTRWCLISQSPRGEESTAHSILSTRPATPPSALSAVPGCHLPSISSPLMHPLWSCVSLFSTLLLSPDLQPF